MPQLSTAVKKRHLRSSCRGPVSGPRNGDIWPRTHVAPARTRDCRHAIRADYSVGKLVRHGQMVATNTATAIKPTRMNEEASGTAAADVKSTRNSVESNEVAVVAP